MQSNDSTKTVGFRMRRYKAICSFISAILIPVSFGILTIVLSLQQESIAKINRDVDLRIATEQHQRNLELATDEQRNAQLVAYIREVSDLLLANNFSLNKQILSSIVRPKTLAALRQLDATRKGYLLRFLLESRLISKRRPPFLGLADADFNKIQIGLVGYATDMRNVSFSLANLENSSFASISFAYSDLSGARLRGASFNLVSFDFVNFHLAQLQGTDFILTNVYKADMTNANMLGSNISLKQINGAGSISAATLPDGSIGRNPNVFVDPNCQQLVYKKNIEQYVNTSQWREWMAQVGQNRILSYIFTGWFDDIDDLRATFTEFDQNGKMLLQYCKRKNEPASSLSTTRSCPGYPWTFTPNSLSNMPNQYKHVMEKIRTHNETSKVHVNITLGQNGTCRDVYLSLETV